MGEKILQTLDLGLLMKEFIGLVSGIVKSGGEEGSY
jgi:hypothetical protein